MARSCVGTPIPAMVAAAAMAITLARLEPRATVVQFDTDVRSVVQVTRRTGIASLATATGGGTDLSAPIRWALGDIELAGGSGRKPVATKPRVEVDAFVLLTDNETWAGNGHCTQHLAEYRAKVNPKARLVCFSMAANHASVVDPADPLQLGAVGLDANLPAIAAEFIGRN